MLLDIGKGEGERQEENKQGVEIHGAAVELDGRETDIADPLRVEGLETFRIC